MEIENLVLRSSGPQDGMVDSDSGRTEPAEIGNPGPQARRSPEAQDGDVRQPSALLRLVDAEPLEPPEDVAGHGSRALLGVVEDEHADAPRLPVRARREHDLPGASRRAVELLGDLRHLPGRSVPEEGERDVQVAAGNDAGVAAELA